METVARDYDTSQDLVWYGKVRQNTAHGVSFKTQDSPPVPNQRTIQVDKKANANSAILLETIWDEQDKEDVVEPTFVVAGIMVKSKLPPVRTKNQ